MTSKVTLDNDFDPQMQAYLLEQEGIEWSGVPKKKFTITFLEWGGTSGCLSFFLLIIGYISYMCFDYGSYGWSALWASVPLSVIFLPELYKYLRRTKTNYAFSKNRIRFQLWRWGRTRTYYIDFAELKSITYEEFKDKSGTVYFMPKRSFNFRTYDFKGGERRFYPTFELIPNVKALCEKMATFHRNRQVF